MPTELFKVVWILEQNPTKIRKRLSQVGFIFVLSFFLPCCLYSARKVILSHQTLSLRPWGRVCNHNGHKGLCPSTADASWGAETSQSRTVELTTSNVHLQDWVTCSQDLAYWEVQTPLRSQGCSNTDFGIIPISKSMTWSQSPYERPETFLWALLGSLKSLLSPLLVAPVAQGLPQAVEGYQWRPCRLLGTAPHSPGSSSAEAVWWAHGCNTTACPSHGSWWSWPCSGYAWVVAWWQRQSKRKGREVTGIKWAVCNKCFTWLLTTPE